MKKTTLILATVAVVVLLLALGRLYFSQADFSLENPYWNGLSGLSGTNVRPLYSLDDLGQAGSSDTLLIVSPRRNYTAGDVNRIALFLQSGGKVVVMDDFGKANSLLEGLDSPVTVDPVPLCEYENYYVNNSFPIVTRFNPSKEFANVSKLVFNHPAPLTVASDAYTLAYTSGRAWLDINDNGKLDGAEQMGIYSVVARADVGNGELLVVGDPDLFINGMAEMGDNRAFMANCLAGTVWMDLSHGEGTTPLGAVYFAVKYDPVLQAAIAALAVIGGAVFVARRDIAVLLKRLVTRGPGNG